MYENGCNIGNVQDCRDCEAAERENERLTARITAIAGWLEQNQPDVFSRGLWDVLNIEPNAQANRLA